MFISKRSVAIYIAGSMTTLGLCIAGFMYGGNTASAAGNTLSGVSFYSDPVRNYASRQAADWRATRPADAEQLDKIGRQPKAYWVGGASKDIRQTTADYTGRAAAVGKTGLLVSYNIPGRDCGSHSAGGSESHAAYRAWVDNLALGIGDRRTVIILEPDALAQMHCLDTAGRKARIDALAHAITSLKKNLGTSVYVDIGNMGWLSSADAADKLQQVNIAAADGFSLNVSNFYATGDTVKYGTDISNKLAGKHFVVDTSRNGQGSIGKWCNPAGRALGQSPTTTTGNGLVDGYLWIKGPGESDGTCNGGPEAGKWWPEYALGLAQRASVVVEAPTTAPVSGRMSGSASAQSDAASKAANTQQSGGISPLVVASIGVLSAIILSGSVWIWRRRKV